MNVAVDKDCYFLVRFEWMLREETTNRYTFTSVRSRTQRKVSSRKKKNQNCPKMGTQGHNFKFAVLPRICRFIHDNTSSLKEDAGDLAHRNWYDTIVWTHWNDRDEQDLETVSALFPDSLYPFILLGPQGTSTWDIKILLSDSQYPLVLQGNFSRWKNAFSMTHNGTSVWKQSETGSGQFKVTTSVCPSIDQLQWTNHM